MRLNWIPSRVLLAVLAATAAAGVLVAAVSAGTVLGTARNDILKGTAKNDKLYGRAGNDRMFGYAGSDFLNGGPGSDTLSGGPGSDTLSGGAGADVLDCGPGLDVAMADALDKVNRNCETVKGLPKPPAATIADAATTEGEAGTTKVLSFTMTLSAASTKPVTVGFATADGTATAGSDYVAGTATLTFNPGETSKTVDVTINGDSSIEADETFTVNLASPVNATITDGSASGTIQNDDKSPAPHAGHYAGTTSQGKAVGFDVGGDVASLTNLSFAIDFTCTEVPGETFPDFPVNLGGSLPIGSDGSWGGGFSGKSASGKLSLNGSIRGAFDGEGKASGTLKVDLTIDTDAGQAHCSSGDVTWTAA